MGGDASLARLFLLGRFALERDGEIVPASAWRRRRPVELLVSLALAPGRVMHREELIDRLWPDKDLAAGANNLHRALHDLRRAAGADLVVTERGTTRLAENLWIDVDAFERAIAKGNRTSLDEAIALYAGDLLPDEPYRDEIVARREGLRQRFIDGALRLAHALDDDVEKRIDVLRRLVAIDPVCERGHRALMEALAEAGRPADAVRQFAECVKSLREHLDGAPSPETLATRRNLGTGTNLPVRRLLGRDADRPLRGRDAERAEVDQFVAASSGTLLIVGEAGIGKTSLLVSCGARAAERGRAVLVGLGNDFDRNVPYARFVDAWTEHLRASEAPLTDNPFLAFEPRPGTSPQEDRLRLFQSVERAIEALGPACLLIEDLHDADESSLHLFHHLARATRHLPLLLVGSLREEEIRVGTALHALIGGLRRERLGRRIDLAPLDAPAVDALIDDLGAPVPDGTRARVTELAEGNPFYVEELVRSLGEGDGALLSSDVRDAVRRRVYRLGPDAERLLSAASVIGRQFSFDVARRAAGSDEEAALDALELSLAARVVEEDDHAYRFRHAISREALYESLTQARRAHLHRTVAAAMEETGIATPEALAFHHQACGQLEPALAYTLVAAGRARARLGLGEAVTFAEQALELMDALGIDDGPDRFAVLRDLGAMRVALADLGAAVRDLDAAASLAFGPSPTELAQARRVCALALIEGGGLEGAEERLSGALDALRADADSPEVSRVLYLMAQLRWHQERFHESYELAQKSLDEARRRGDDEAVAKGYEMLALACHALGRWQEGLEHERARQQLGGGAIDVDNAFDVHLCLWEYHLYGDRGLAEMRGPVERMREQSRRMQAPRALALCLCFEGTLDFQAGRWEAAERSLREAVELYARVGSACGESLSRQRLGVLLTVLGRIDEGKDVLDEGIAVGQRAAMRSHCLTRLHAAMARNRLAASDLEAAEASVSEGLATVLRHGHCATCSSLLLPEAVRVAIAREDLAAAERHARDLETVAARFGSRAWSAMAQSARGRVHAARGAFDDAARTFEEAARLFDAIGYAHEGTRAAEALEAARNRTAIIG